MNENMVNKKELVATWLRILFFASFVGLVNTALAILPVETGHLTGWISKGVVAAALVCMFRLASANERYRKAGILRAVVLGCSLVTSSVVTFVASILSIVADYQEFSAHSELMDEADPRLSRKWHSLFNWSIISGVLISGASVIAVLIVATLKMDAVRASNIIIGLFSIPQLVIEGVYLLYLKKMIDYFQNEEENYGVEG